MNLLNFARQELLRRRQAAGPIDVRPGAAPGLEDRRREVLESLTEWCRHCGYEPAAHHRFIIQELEALERGDFSNLAIAAPPGSAKTTYTSILFPCWYLARNPTHLVLSGSHTQEFASRKIGRKVRNLIFRNASLLGVSVSADSSSMNDWTLDQGGSYRAVGVGVAVAGERADLGLVEDPFARWEDAQRPLIQDEVWSWYSADFTPRLKPGAKRIVICTRFNEFDLLGRIFERDRVLGIPWRVIRLPMIAEDSDPIGREPGERLWAEWFTEQQVTEARADAQKWSALYQQSPSVESGDYFKAEWLRPCDNPPPPRTLRIYGGSDYAVTQNGGDYTVHIVVGVDSEWRLYLLDVWRQQASSDRWVESFCDLVRYWKPMAWGEEKGQINAGVGPFLEQRMRQRQAYVRREQFASKADKAIQAQAIRGRMALDGLYVPTNEPWYPDFRAELMAFPAGKHDDQVDALGKIGLLLDQMLKGTKPTPTEAARIPGLNELTFDQVINNLPKPIQDRRI